MEFARRASAKGQSSLDLIDWPSTYAITMASSRLHQRNRLLYSPRMPHISRLCETWDSTTASLYGFGSATPGKGTTSVVPQALKQWTRVPAERHRRRQLICVIMRRASYQRI